MGGWAWLAEGWLGLILHQVLPGILALAGSLLAVRCVVGPRWWRALGAVAMTVAPLGLHPLAALALTFLEGKLKLSPHIDDEVLRLCGLAIPFVGLPLTPAVLPHVFPPLGTPSHGRVNRCLKWCAERAPELGRLTQPDRITYWSPALRWAALGAAAGGLVPVLIRTGYQLGIWLMVAAGATGAWMLSQLARSCSVAESTRAAVAAAISCAAGLHIGAAVFRWRSHAGARPALQMRELTYNIPLIDDAHPQDLFAWPWMLLVGVLIVLLAPRLLRLTGRLWSRLLNPPPPPERPVVIPPSPLSPEA